MKSTTPVSEADFPKEEYIRTEGNPRTVNRQENPAVHDKPSVIKSIKRNINYLNAIVLLVIIVILFLNVKFLYNILDYIPSYSIIVMLTVTSCLVIASLCISRIISRQSIREFEEYDNKLNRALQSLQEEMYERRKVESQLQIKTLYDHLTGLPNRDLLTRRLARLMTRPERHDNYQFAVLFIDLDRFKVINDSLGHNMGDQLLIDVAQRLDACIRPVDTVARFGGDEFVALLDDINETNDAVLVVERIQQDLSVPFDLNGHEVFITASIGIALSATGYNLSEDILRDADSAMYRAKALGRARYEIFDNELHRSAVQLLHLESDLWRAVERMEFLVYYQPIISLKDGTITGAEALLRWKHPQHGFIPPLKFIPLAEETGLISAIGEWILWTACKESAAWQRAISHPLTVDVNFSSRQFHYQNVPELVQKVLQETGLEPQLLNIEITESIAMEPSSINTLTKLTAMGIQTSIDDFGTGYSSLGSLKRFSINVIKIDKIFIKDITKNDNVEAIIKAIIAMAHALNMKVIAEGVERHEQLHFLRAHNCDEVQGYLFSPPVSPEEFSRLLVSGRYPLPEISSAQLPAPCDK